MLYRILLYCIVSYCVIPYCIILYRTPPPAGKCQGCRTRPALGQGLAEGDITPQGGQRWVHRTRPPPGNIAWTAQVIYVPSLTFAILPLTPLSYTSPPPYSQPRPRASLISFDPSPPPLPPLLLLSHIYISLTFVQSTTTTPLTVAKG